MDESSNNIPNLSEQLRGKSTTELLDQMKKKFDDRRRLFNTRNPTFDSFSRFDDNDMSHSSDIKSHLQNLAKRHPEFADQLQGNPWSESEPKPFPSNSHKDWDRAHTVPMFVEKTESPEEQASSDNKGGTEGTKINPASEGASGQQESPNSSEEDKTGKRFTSKIEITPFDPSSQQEEKRQTPPVQPQVRHIPIYVEGRKEPIIPKSGTDAQQMNEGKKQVTQPVEKNETGKKEPAKEEKDNTSIALKNTLEQIDEVERDVNLLEEKVRNMNEKNNRLDKEYLFLDEMLTRNLIKLDVIEVNGIEDIRARRKNVIKNIQRCISLLESKVPSESKISDDNKCIEEGSCCTEETENGGNVNIETTTENASSN